MSRDLVYLYELDFPTRRKSFSLEEFRKLPKVIYAYEVIYKTIFIENKNIVLSYDQLVDTLFFQAWYEYDPETVKKLFIDKRFKISRFGNNTTPIDYLKNSLRKSWFVFSGSVENLNGDIKSENVEDIKNKILSFTDSLDVEVFNGCDYLSNSNKNILVKYCLFLLSIGSILADASLEKEESKKIKKVDKEDDLYFPAKTSVRITLNELVTLFINYKFDNNYIKEKELLATISKNVSSDYNNYRSEWYRKIDDLESPKYDKYKEQLKIIIDACHNIAVENSINWKKNGKFLGLNKSDYDNVKFDYIKRVIKNKEEINNKQKSDVNATYIDKDLWKLTIESPVYDYSNKLICCNNISEDKQYYCMYKNIEKFKKQSISYIGALVIFFIILSITSIISKQIANVFLNDDNLNNICIWIIYNAVTFLVSICISITAIAIAKKYFKITFNTIFSQTWKELKKSWNDYLIKKKMEKIFEKFKEKDEK